MMCVNGGGEFAQAGRIFVQPCCKDRCRKNGGRSRKNSPRSRKNGCRSRKNGLGGRSGSRGYRRSSWRVWEGGPRLGVVKGAQKRDLCSAASARFELRSCARARPQVDRHTTSQRYVCRARRKKSSSRRSRRSSLTIMRQGPSLFSFRYHRACGVMSIPCWSNGVTSATIQDSQIDRRRLSFSAPRPRTSSRTRTSPGCSIMSWGGSFDTI